ncbi:MAG TPA: trigger factor [Planctomycetota bacterium]|nr:trigger factor [Planctomycetota bacterium]
MEITVEKTGPCAASVTLSVPADEFSGAYQNGLKSAASQVKMKGFRPGKVPTQVVERQHGEAVRTEVLEGFVRDGFQRAVKENDLRPLSSPKVPRESFTLEDDGSFKLDFEVQLKPEFDLPDYKDQAIESELEPVLDQELEATLADLRRQHSKPEPAGEEGLATGGMALCDLKWMHGEEVALERSGLRLGLDTPPPGVEEDAWAAAFAGKTSGDETEVAMTLPDTVESEAARGQEGTCRVAIKEAFKMIPPTDEDVRGLLALDADGDIEATVRERIGDAKREAEESRIEGALLERLIEATEMDLPETMVEEQVAGREHEMTHQLEEQGMSEDQVKESIESNRVSAREQVAKGLKALFLVEALAEAEDLLVSGPELKAEFEQIASRNQASVEEVTKYYQENNLVQQMAVEVLERKVRHFLRESATVSEPS